MARKLEVSFSLIREDEDMPFEGNCSAIDPETDKSAEDYIRAELERGNEWAWCCAHVRAECEDFTGDAYLGGCSYGSAEEFKAPGGYYADMCQEALDDLRAGMVDTINAGERAAKLLGRLPKRVRL
jgi:hypothetical protein